MMSLTTIAESSLAVLGRYLDHLAYLDGIEKETRELARIGADVIAASMQCDQVARWSFDGFQAKEHSPLPLGVFTMSRSSMYGLHYLDSMDKVHTEEKLVNLIQFFKKSAKRWNSSPFCEKYGRLSTKPIRMRWNKLSEMVHIIPQLRDEGGAKFHHVSFSFDDDLSRPSQHAGLPDYFMEEAEICLEWRSKVAIASIWNFRETWPQFFNCTSFKIRKELEDTIWPECRDLITSTPIEDDVKNELLELANRMFP